MKPSESPTVRSYRELLGVESTASLDDLKKAYYRMAFLYHPDRNPDPEARLQFERVQHAYEVLTNASEVERLNHDYLKEKLFRHCIDGLNISFGALFGYRLFRYGTDRIRREFRIGFEKPKEHDGDPTAWLRDISVEENHSILDSPAYDALELVYAGKFSLGDEERLQSSFKSSEVVQLPWIVLNNQGIFYFLNQNYRKAFRCYSELNSRIPNNIIFMYRLGLCHILLAFQDASTSWLGRMRPEKKNLIAGVHLLKHCIHVAETRPVGKQDCLVIRKMLAEILMKTSHKRQAQKVWTEIYHIDPKSIEAAFHVKGESAARRLLAKKKNHESSTSPHLLRLKAGSK